LFDLPRLKPGDRVFGKWTGTVYYIERKLGEGANGSVYLARSPTGPSSCALKIGLDPYELQSEMNALQSLSKLQPAHPHITFPCFYETDDYECLGETYPFYTMSFVSGVPVSKVAMTQGSAALLRCGMLLLNALRCLHGNGWAFGDLKGENVLVTAGGEPALVDFGGATPFGRAVKQYSELYDRGYWRAGERTAEASYDMFSFAVLMLEAAEGRSRIQALAEHTGRRSKETLLALADGSAALRPVSSCLKRMLGGEYARIDEALRDWEHGLKHCAPSGRNAQTANWSVYWFAGAAVSFIASVCWIVLK
jgi:serine/threonine protein kinase